MHLTKSPGLLHLRCTGLFCHNEGHSVKIHLALKQRIGLKILPGNFPKYNGSLVLTTCAMLLPTPGMPSWPSTVKLNWLPDFTAKKTQENTNTIMSYANQTLCKVRAVKGILIWVCKLFSEMTWKLYCMCRSNDNYSTFALDEIVERVVCCRD